LAGSDGFESENANTETAIRQLVAQAMAGDGVVDIYAEAGLLRPDITALSDNLLTNFANSDRKNLQIEALRRLLADETARLSTRNVVAARDFSDLLRDAIARYQDRTLSSAQVMQTLSEISIQLQAQRDRATTLQMTDDQLAFYDAIGGSDPRLLGLSDSVLREISSELEVVVRRDTKPDWMVKEQVRARLRATIKRILRRRGYPTGRTEEAVIAVMRQAEAMASSGEAYVEGRG
jgi:type I restriction enzyme R subunit